VDLCLSAYWLTPERQIHTRVTRAVLYDEWTVTMPTAAAARLAGEERGVTWLLTQPVDVAALACVLGALFAVGVLWVFLERHELRAASAVVVIGAAITLLLFGASYAGFLSEELVSDPGSMLRPTNTAALRNFTDNSNGSLCVWTSADSPLLF
jgi:hypothetical protein